MKLKELIEISGCGSIWVCVKEHGKRSLRYTTIRNALPKDYFQHFSREDYGDILHLEDYEREVYLITTVLECSTNRNIVAVYVW